MENKTVYRVVQLNLTPETEVSYVLFDKSLSIFSMTSLKHHREYFNFLCLIQLDLPVCMYIRLFSNI